MNVDLEQGAASRLTSTALTRVAAASGYDVSARMLETFRAQGLLPRPARVGHHRRAPLWISPAGADRQLISLLGWREHTKDPNVLRVLLWADGFPIPPTVVRDALADGLRTMLGLLEKEIAAHAGEDGLDAGEDVGRRRTVSLIAGALAAKRGRNSLPRHGRVSAAQRSGAIELLLRVFVLGEPADATTEKAEAVERVLGLAPNGRRHRVHGAGPWLTGPAEVFFDAAECVALPHLLPVVLDATEAELEAARHFVMVLWRCLPLMARMLTAAFDDENYAGMSELRHLDQHPEIIPIMVPAVIGMLRAGWEENLQAVAGSLGVFPELAAQIQDLLELPSKTVEANIGGLPADARQQARRLIVAAIEGKLGQPPPDRLVS